MCCVLHPSERLRRADEVPKGEARRSGEALWPADEVAQRGQAKAPYGLVRKMKRHKRATHARLYQHLLQRGQVTLNQPPGLIAHQRKGALAA
jgi:hypothetical protein